jgi:glycosyltransferase involved in cell wall biosynthesis
MKRICIDTTRLINLKYHKNVVKKTKKEKILKVSGFTFIKNGEMLGYPFVASIKSILPILDEFIIAVGKSDDNTLEIIKSIKSKKIKIIETQWNEEMHDRGFVYAQQKMIAQYNCTGDWAFYLEGDELVHENDLDTIYKSMKVHLDNKNVEALYFNYHHFYGVPEQVFISGYKTAPRIIRNTIRSYSPDGLFFVVMDKNKKGRYPFAADAGCYIYHYGHVRKTSCNKIKDQQVSKYWGEQNKKLFENYGNIDIAEIRPFKGTHPIIVKNWLKNESERNFMHNPEYKITLKDRKHRIRFWLFDKLGIDISHKHYVKAKI